MLLRCLKDASVIMPGVCDYVMRHGKGEIRLQMELRFLGH